MISTKTLELKWFQRKRLEWIAETLRVFGYINRKHIERKFGISNIQASGDLQLFQREYPGQMEYDMHAKRYVQKGTQ